MKARGLIIHVGVVLLVCVLAYSRGQTDGWNDQFHENERVEASLLDYSEGISRSDLSEKDERIDAAKDWIETELEEKVPKILKRPWYVSLPGWLHHPQSLNAQLEETIRELNWK